MDKKEKKEINDLFLSFVDWLRSLGKSEGTLHTYLGVIQSFYHFLGQKDVDLQKIQSTHIQAYIHFLEVGNKSPGTVEKHFAALSMFSKFLNKPELMINIQRKLKVKNDDIPESLSLDEQEYLLENVLADGNLRNIAIIYTLLHTGIRVSELCELNKNDVILNESFGFLEIKNGNSQGRTIPLSKEVRKYLGEYQKSTNRDMDAMFISNVNQRITARAVQYILKKYDVNPHKLRHTFCQRLINNGIDLQTVSKLAGHKDINVTKRYSKDMVFDLKTAIDRTF